MVPDDGSWPSIIYINLEEDTDRDRAMQELFERLRYPPTSVHRFNAIRDEVALEGCRRSHIGANILGVNFTSVPSNCPYYIICEDDLKLVGDFHGAVARAMQLRPDCVLLECGEDLEEQAVLQTTSEPHFMRFLSGGNNAACYMVHHEYGKRLVEHWQQNPMRDVDHTWQALWSDHVVLLALPQVFVQTAGWSSQPGVGMRRELRPFDLKLWARYHPCSHAHWTVSLGQLGDLWDLGLEPSAQTCDQALAALRRGAQWDVATCLLQVVSAPPLLVEERVEEQAPALNGCLDGCFHERRQERLAESTAAKWEELCHVLARLQGQVLEPSSIKLCAALRGCELAAAWQQAASALRRRWAAGAFPDAVSLCAALEGCVRSGAWREALHLLGEARESRLPPEELPSGAAALAERADVVRARWAGVKLHDRTWERAGALLAGMLPRGVELDARVLEPALDGLTPRRGSDLAVDTLESLCLGRLQAVAVLHSAAMGVLERGRQWAAGALLLQRMAAAQLEAAGGVRCRAASAALAAGDWQRSVLSLDALRRSHASPDLRARCAAVAAGAAQLHWQAALAGAVA